MRLEEIGFPFFRRQAVGDLRNQRSDDFFLLLHRDVQLRREIGEQQFFVRVVVDDGRRERSGIAAIGALGVIGKPSQQPLLRGGVGADIKKLFYVYGNELMALRALNLCLWHEVSSCK